MIGLKKFTLLCLTIRGSNNIPQGLIIKKISIVGGVLGHSLIINEIEEFSQKFTT